MIEINKQEPNAAQHKRPLPLLFIQNGTRVLIYDGEDWIDTDQEYPAMIHLWVTNHPEEAKKTVNYRDAYAAAPIACCTSTSGRGSNV